jgi:tetratricopeptide (TPR) repeat protein
MIMRAMNDPMERQQLIEAFPTLTRKDVDELEGQRMAHKELAVLLHEWAHNYGALHEEGRTMLMSPGYDQTASRLSEANEKLVSLALAARAGNPAAMLELRKHVTGSDWGGWDRGERERLMNILDDAEPAVPGGAASTDEDEDPLAHAQALRDAGKMREALAEVDAWAKSGKGEAASWEAVARAYLGLEAYQRVEATLARAGDAAAAGPLRLRVERLRRHRGIFGLAAEDEPDAAAFVDKVSDEIREERHAAARKMLDRAPPRYRKLPGVLALQCALALQKGNLAGADKLCKQSVKTWDEAILGYFYGAQVAEGRGDRAGAIRQYEKVVALDPEEPTGYQALAPLYRAAGAADKLHELRMTFLKKFKRSL